MNDVTQNKKEAKEDNKEGNNKTSILKSLAIVGFIGIIILIAWFSVKIVGVVPDAFSSLASLAESLNQNDDVDEEDRTKLVVTSDTLLTNSGEPVNLSWETTDKPGSYAFSYECEEGVSVDIIETDGIKSVGCGVNYNIGKTNSLTISINSEKEKYTDINYTISFLGTNDTEPRASGTSSLTVVNDSYQEVPDNDPETDQTTPPNNNNGQVTTGSGSPTYQQEFVYTIPTSDPNGQTDLATKFISTGKIIGNTFFPGTISREDDGAIQFEVKNYGTKTSQKWTFEVSLPNGGTYTSDRQNPLKPNERAVLTIGFPTTDDSRHTFKVTVNESTDKNTANNKFSETVQFVK